MNKNKKNIYTCQNCGKKIVTIDVDEGTTPFMTACVYGCKEMMRSSFYQVNQSLKVTHEWYKPSSTTGMSPSIISHVNKGGLLLRKKDHESN